MKIVILDAYTANPGDISWDGWKETGCELEVYDRTDVNDVVARSLGTEMIITNKVVISDEIMQQLPQLQYIGVTATGYNIVDVEAAHRRGIVVTNIPAYSTNSVAQMVFAHLLNITNNVAAHAKAVEAGEWQNCADFAFWLTEQRELAGLTIGIVGMGNTGTQTARIAIAFGMNVVAYSSKDEAALQQILGSDKVRKAASLDELFTVSDVISLHCPLTPETHHLVNEHTLSLMRPTSIVINTGRGPLVDDHALADALNARRIYAAGIDVLTQEPPREGSPLIDCPFCNITPHIAWATMAARHRLLDVALGNVKAFLNGAPQNQV